MALQRKAARFGLALVDADLQHDEMLLPALYDAVTADGYDLAIGNRYMPGDGVGSWSRQRQIVSRWATRIS